MYVIGAIIALTVLFLFLFLGSLYQYYNVCQIKPTEEKCIKCGSINVEIEERENGTKTETRKTGNIVQTITSPVTKKIMACKDCRATWDYISEEEVYSQKHVARTRVILFGIMFAVSLVFSLWIFRGNGDGNEEENLKSEEALYENTQKSEDVDGFEKPEYDKFNSYASENGLDGTYIYVTGQSIEPAITEVAAGIIIKDKDNNQWCVIVPEYEGFNHEEHIEIVNNLVDNQDIIRVYGQYIGFSDKFNLPTMTPVAYDDDYDYIDKVRIEKRNQFNEFEIIWSWEEYENEVIWEYALFDDGNEQNTLTQEEQFLSDSSDYIDENISKKLYSILLNELGFTEIEFIGLNSGDSVWDIYCDDMSILAVASDDVYRIWDGNYTFYEEGTVLMTKQQMENTLVKDENKTSYYAIAQDIVMKYLKNSESASFPWGTDEIGFEKNGDVVAVQGYVDATNSFGGQVRSWWTVEFKLIDLDALSYEVQYVNIDGQTYGTHTELNN